jgi:energy-coupling factor transporter ATP-binding protein EcfA2
VQHRPALLLAISALGAVGFVVLRVVYRIIFGGAGAGPTQLPSFAPLRLPGPFSHIVLFGPLTREGLEQAAVSALPFAAVILLTGALVSLWDPRKLILLAPRMRVGGSLVLAAGIAIAAFPVVIATVSQTRRTMALRGMKPGLRGFIPVLEITIERAIATALALHSRGIHSRGIHSRGLQSRSSLPVQGSTEYAVECDHWSAPTRGLNPVVWQVAAGERIVLTGATGVGKTTLVEAIAGVVNLRGDTPSTGRLNVGVSPRNVAYIPHDPSRLFLTSRVIDDVQVGLVAGGLSVKDAKVRAQQTLVTYGLSHLALRVPHTLSSGEVALVALVMVLVTKPQLLLLDEPLSSLSEETRERFLGVLAAYCDQSGATVIMTDHHRGARTLAGFDYWQLSDSGVSPGCYQATPLVGLRKPYRPLEPDTVLQVSNLSVSWGDTEVLHDVSFEIARGETCVVVGDNGAGKSSLLQTLASPTGSEVVVRGASLSTFSPRARPRHVALVSATPSDLFHTSSVTEELSLADRVAGGPKGLTKLSFDSILPDFWRSDISGATHPRDLSRGQQTALAIAVQLSHKPAVLLLDEPMRGLDEAARHALLEVLACVVETGTAVVVASHHAEHGDIPHDRLLEIDNGILSEQLIEVIT